MEHTPKIIIATEDDSCPLKIGARVEAEIRDRIKLLEKRIATYRKHVMPTGRDETELEKLRQFLASLGLVLVVCLAITCGPSIGRADDLLPPRAPCQPYGEARACLDAIKAEALACIARKHNGDGTPAQRLECINDALAKMGASDD